MTGPDPGNLRLERLRKWRNRQERDYSLSFLQGQFKEQIARPHRQLSQVSALWGELVPADLIEHTRLEGLRRGILRVSVDSSSRLYELDRLLRQGLERQLIRSHKGGGLRKVRLRVDNSWVE